ncbi:winged helix-turn-helix domain-containing protein [Saccharopolyspora erythraea]|uniref:winged helix-turn-helix domain-containing protein n=1 Tax=Saccharopolyspora erythraea TaxID=1836 RepID=UPI001BAE1FA7|nr:helix-turn-helix domain-containing protein [Saccharopolyspora erythraea]
MIERHERVLDARSLRGLAHPLRIRLLGMLRADGPATATQLAKRLAESSGTTSWHLRQLAEHGFIEEDTDRGTKRERWWRASHELTVLEAERFTGDPDLGEALDVYIREVLATHYRRSTAFLGEIRDWSPEWLRAATISDTTLSLSPSELAELSRQIESLIDWYRREPRPTDERITVHVHAFPRRSST